MFIDFFSIKLLLLYFPFALSEDELYYTISDSKELWLFSSYNFLWTDCVWFIALFLPGLNRIKWYRRILLVLFSCSLAWLGRLILLFTNPNQNQRNCLCRSKASGLNTWIDEVMCTKQRFKAKLYRLLSQVHFKCEGCRKKWKYFIFYWNFEFWLWLPH